MPEPLTAHLPRQATVFSLHIDAQIAPAFGIALAGKFGMNEHDAQKTYNNHHPQSFAVDQLRDDYVESILNAQEDRGTVRRNSSIAARVDFASTTQVDRGPRG